MGRWVGRVSGVRIQHSEVKIYPARGVDAMVLACVKKKLVLREGGQDAHAFTSFTTKAGSMNVSMIIHYLWFPSRYARKVLHSEQERKAERKEEFIHREMGLRF